MARLVCAYVAHRPRLAPPQRDNTAILVAAECGNTYAMHKLRSHGADPRAVNEEGHDVVILAALGGHSALLADLLEWGKPPKVRQYAKPWTMNSNDRHPNAPVAERMDVPSLRCISLVVRAACHAPAPAPTSPPTSPAAHNAPARLRSRRLGTRR